MSYRSANQIWRDSGAEITSKSFNKWISDENKEFHDVNEGSGFDFIAWLNDKYDTYEANYEKYGSIEEPEEEVDNPTIAGVQVDFDESKLYELYPADGGTKIPADANESPKTILGLKPVVFVTVASAMGLTVLLLIVTIARGKGKPAQKTA